MLDEEAKNKIIDLFNQLILGIPKSAQNLTLEEILRKSKPLTLELFSQNIEEYFYFIVAQRVTKSFSTKLGTVIEKVSAILVESQGGEIILGKPNPFDLKFIHPDGNEYWIEIKSINAQNSSNTQTINERKQMAKERNCLFRLCVYNDETLSSENYKLNGNEFWELVGGSKQTGKEILSILNGLGKSVSIHNVVNNRVEELTKQYQMR